MIPREMVMKILGQMPDAQLMQALSAVQGQPMPGGMDMELGLGAGEQPTGQHMGLNDPAMAGLHFDAAKDGVKGWSKVQIQQGKDTRPELQDKKYMVPKQGLGQQGLGMPQDSGEDAYSAPGGM